MARVAHAGVKAAATVASGILLLAAFAGAFAHPLWPAALVPALVIYCAALWVWPALWLLVIPALVPNLDFAPWTGWLLIQEPDLFILATVAILPWRVRLARADLLPGGIGGGILALFVGATLLSTAIGLFVPSVFGGSAIVYLTQANTIRAVKPLLLALALLPFLRARTRTQGDGLPLFGVGMLLGLAGVVGLVAVERSIFVSLADFQSDYRVAAAFSSMHVGGGHIGAYLAMALPFLAVPLLWARARWWPLVAALAASLAVGAGYALAVTFARTAYAAALTAASVTMVGLVLAGFRRARTFLRDVLAPAALLAGLAAAVVAAAGTTYMSARFAGAAADLSVREANWSAGLSVRDHGPRALLLGTGLGTYPRLWFDRAPHGDGPSNIRAGQQGGVAFVTLEGRQRLFFVQKITPEPGQKLRLEFRARARAADSVIDAGLCEKWLLYSYACATGAHRATTPGVWEDAAIPLALPAAGPSARGGRPALPLEFYFSAGPGTEIDITAVRLADAAGTNLLRNGDFAQATAFWFFTDDNHVLWRIFNQYLTSFFEGGLLGIVVFVLLIATGLAAVMRALARGERLAAPLAGALAAFAVSCLFDAPLEAPRLALLFYLIAFIAIGLWHPAVPDSRTHGLVQAGTGGTHGTAETDGTGETRGSPGE